MMKIRVARSKPRRNSSTSVYHEPTDAQAQNRKPAPTPASSLKSPAQASAIPSSGFQHEREELCTMMRSLLFPTSALLSRLLSRHCTLLLSAELKYSRSAARASTRRQTDGCSSCFQISKRVDNSNINQETFAADL